MTPLASAKAALEARDRTYAALDGRFVRALRDARAAGYTIEEIATAVGLSVAGVHKALRREAA